jgi:hypothetical protein
MNKLLCELKSALIFNRKKRQHYRTEHYMDLHPDLKIERIVQRQLSTFAMHRRTFLPYKGKFTGKDVVIVAAGPTVNDYKPIPGAVHIGVNMAYKTDKVEFDYYFFMDSPDHLRDMVLGINAYLPGKCRKFYGTITEDVYGPGDCTCSESDVISADALRYRTTTGALSKIAYDISAMPLVDYGTIVFSAFQFALWGNAARIYLVGCDCSSAGHFFSKEKNWLPLEKIFQGYEDMKKFAQKWYPDTKIISVNPVGLKGLYEDLYQK